MDGVVHELAEVAQRVVVVQPVQARAVGHLRGRAAPARGAATGGRRSCGGSCGARRWRRTGRDRAARRPSPHTTSATAPGAASRQVAHGGLQPPRPRRHQQVLERGAERDEHAAPVGVAARQRALRVGEQPDAPGSRLEAPGLRVPVARGEHGRADQRAHEVEAVGRPVGRQRPGLERHRGAPRRGPRGGRAGAGPGGRRLEGEAGGRAGHDDEEVAAAQATRRVRQGRVGRPRRPRGSFHGRRVRTGGASVNRPRGTAWPEPAYRGCRRRRATTTFPP